jgi:hypothetical protein
VSTAWFTGAQAASSHVECGDETHTVRWRDGVFEIPAHRDPESERALAALGGQPCRCVELLSAWERHAADPLVLLLGPRGCERLGTARLRRSPASRAHRARLMQLGVTEPELSPLEELLSLDDPIPRRFVATVAAALLERAAEPEIAAALYGALYGRLLASLERWRPTRFAARLDLVITAGEPRFIQARDDHLHAALSLGWLTEVWGRELDVVDDELTLAARSDGHGEFDLITVDSTMVTHTRSTGGR